MELIYNVLFFFYYTFFALKIGVSKYITKKSKKYKKRLKDLLKDFKKII